MEVILQGMNAVVRQRLIFLPGLALAGEEGFEIFPRLVGRQIQVPVSAGVGEILCQENKVIGGCCNLLGGEWGSFCVDKVNGHFDLVDECFERLVDAVCGRHAGDVLLQGCGGNLVVIILEVSNHLEAT